MTALMGLDSRLRLARLLVLMRPGDAEPAGDWPAQAGAIILDPGVNLSWQRPSVGPGSRQGPLVGLRLDGSESARESAEHLLPDLLLDGDPEPGWPHQWALRGRTVVDLPPATGGEEPDFWVIAPASDLAALVRRLATVAPPSDPTMTPWFVLVEDAEAASVAVDAGAARLAVAGADADLVEQCNRLVRPLWQQPDMRGYTLAALAPRADQGEPQRRMKRIQRAATTPWARLWAAIRRRSGAPQPGQS